MTHAAENARQASYLDVANYRAQSALYYQSISEALGCS
jgi:hypothetical protein